MYEGDLSSHESTNTDVFRSTHGSREGKDFLPFRMAPPTSANRAAGYSFRERDNRTFAGFKDDALLPDKFQGLRRRHPYSG